MTWFSSKQNPQGKVKAFHVVTENPIGRSPKDIPTERKRLRASLICEEAAELFEAMGGPEKFVPSLDFQGESDLVEVADALADLLYVVYGTAVEFGIEIEPIFEEVHRSNMAKQGGPTREDGKTLKPEGWTPPDIEGCLRRQGWK